MPDDKTRFSITPAEAVEKIEDAKRSGKIFTVRFIKRTTGEVRDMTCRGGVKSHLKGGEQAYDPKAHRLVTVFDMVKMGYRSINTDSIVHVRTEGAEFIVA